MENTSFVIQGEFIYLIHNLKMITTAAHKEILKAEHYIKAGMQKI